MRVYGRSGSYKLGPNQRDDAVDVSRFVVQGRNSVSAALVKQSAPALCSFLGSTRFPACSCARVLLPWALVVSALRSASCMCAVVPWVLASLGPPS